MYCCMCYEHITFCSCIIYFNFGQNVFIFSFLDFILLISFTLVYILLLHKKFTSIMVIKSKPIYPSCKLMSDKFIFQTIAEFLSLILPLSLFSLSAFLLFFFYKGSQKFSAQGLFLSLYPGITPGDVLGKHKKCQRLNSGLASFEESILPISHPLMPCIEFL